MFREFFSLHNYAELRVDNLVKLTACYMHVFCGFSAFAHGSTV